MNDVSVIIPFYNKLEEFRTSIKYNYDQFQKVNEVIVIIDEKIDNPHIFSFLFNYNINFKFVMNEENHPWRNPAVVINKGIEIAISDKIIVISPETILLKNFLFNLSSNCDKKSFSVGLVIFTTLNHFFENDLLTNIKNAKNANNAYLNLEKRSTYGYIGPVFYGSICCTKQNFKKVDNYTVNFSLNGWGGEDDNIRFKLEKHNIKKICVNNAIAFHIESEYEFKHRKQKNLNKNHSHSLFNKFNNINIRNLSNSNIKSALDKLNYIIDYGVSTNICPYYPIIALVPCYNEEKNITEYINNIGNFVDGIIFLDDGSTDNSWNMLSMKFNTTKILIKAKIKRDGFNDLKNRNYLLEILKTAIVDNNIKVDWLLWLDMDERLPNNKKLFHNVRENILSKDFQADNVYLPLFHMWNEHYYNAEYPYSINGIQFKLRLIRNKTNIPYIIKSKNNLHFTLSYYNGNVGAIFLQIKHLGYLSNNLRIEKFKKYTKVYDKNRIQKSYDHIINHNAKLLPYNYKILINYCQNPNFLNNISDGLIHKLLISLQHSNSLTIKF